MMQVIQEFYIPLESGDHEKPSCNKINPSKLNERATPQVSKTYLRNELLTELSPIRLLDF